MAPVTYAGSSALHTASVPYARLNTQLSDSTYKLSSGDRFLPAQESPELTIAQRLQSQVSSYRAAQQTGAASSSLLGTAASGLSQISALVDTLSGLAAQASDGNITDHDRAYLQASFAAALASIDSIASNTSFGGQPLLDGSLSDADGGSSIPFTFGEAPEGNITIDIRSVTTDRLFGGVTPDLTSASNAAAAVTAVANANTLLQPVVSGVEGDLERVFFAGQNLNAVIGGIDAARRDLTETDVPSESQLFTRLNNQKGVALAVLAQARNLSPGLLQLLHTPRPSAKPH